VAFAREVGLGALGIDHRLFLGSYRTGHFPVITRRPLVKSRADLGRLQARVVTTADVYPEVERAQRAIGSSGIALYVEISFCFDQAVADLGFDNFCYLLRDDPGLIGEVFRRYEEINGNLIDVYSSIPEIDFIWISDDVAYKGGPLLAPEMLREHVFPVFRRLAARVRKPWIYHSDGALGAVLDDILSLGCQAIHPIEAGCNDIHALKAQIGDRVALHGNLPVDLIARGSPQEVAEEAQRLLTHLGRGGGYLFSSGNSIPYFARAENVLSMAQALRRFNAERWGRVE